MIVEMILPLMSGSAAKVSVPPLAHCEIHRHLLVCLSLQAALAHSTIAAHVRRAVFSYLVEQADERARAGSALEGAAAAPLCQARPRIAALSRHKSLP